MGFLARKQQIHERWKNFRTDIVRWKKESPVQFASTVILSLCFSVAMAPAQNAAHRSILAPSAGKLSGNEYRYLSETGCWCIAAAEPKDPTTA